MARRLAFFWLVLFAALSLVGLVRLNALRKKHLTLLLILVLFLDFVLAFGRVLWLAVNRPWANGAFFP